MLYYVICDNYEIYKNNKIIKQFIDPKNIIYIDKKYKNPIVLLLIICDKLKPNDIVCFIDQPNTILLKNNGETENNFYKTASEYGFNIKKDILWSKFKKPQNAYEKYSQDKSFTRFGNHHIDTRLFIGTVNAITSFWKPYGKLFNEHKYYFNKKQKKVLENKPKKNQPSYHSYVHSYVHNIKRNYQIKIDYVNKFFYNYSNKDSIIFTDKIIVNNELPCIISGFELLNIHCPTIIGKPIFKIKNASTKFYNYKSNKFEIFIILMAFLLTYFVKNKLFFLMINLLVLLEIIHFNLFTKHINRNAVRKISYTIIDFMHMVLIGMIFYLSLNFECNKTKLLVLNLIYLSIILSFFIYKRCALSILENYVLKIDNNFGTMSLKKRLKYFFDLNSKYELIKGTPESNHNNWIKANTYTITLILLSNLICLTIS
jgi:hypothetical protein